MVAAIAPVPVVTPDVDPEPPGEVHRAIGGGVIDQQEVVCAPYRQGADRPLQRVLRLVGGEGDDGEMAPGSHQAADDSRSVKAGTGPSRTTPGRSAGSPAHS